MILCKDCKWMDCEGNNGSGNCCYRPQLKFSYINPVNGNTNKLGYSCASERDNERSCGPEAYYFEEKEINHSNVDGSKDDK